MLLSRAAVQLVLQRGAAADAILLVLAAGAGSVEAPKHFLALGAGLRPGGAAAAWEGKAGDVNSLLASKGFSVPTAGGRRAAGRAAGRAAAAGALRRLAGSLAARFSSFAAVLVKEFSGPN